MHKAISATVFTVSLGLAPALAQADDMVYAGFPVTVKGYSGSKTTSESYTGQIARHVLHDSLKKLAGTGNGMPNPALKQKMLDYYSGKIPGREILAPATKGPFVVGETTVDQISGKKNLAGKTFKAQVTGMPNNMAGPDLVTFWIDKASSANKGFDANNGYDYSQLISKYIMGSVFYNQVVDNYLDENLSAAKKPNDKPYKDGAAYTGKEHSWDEAFGYFGAPAHVMKLTAAQVYAIAKRKADAIADADYNGNGKVDLKSEMTFGPAYYAASFDKKGKTKYLHTIAGAFLDGRKLITSAGGKKLTEAQRSTLREYATTISANWERVLAEATFKYAGSVYQDMAKLQAIVESKGDATKQFRTYVKHWGELKGFALALQSGKTNLGETATRLNRLIGAGPLLLNVSQVVDIDNEGNYVRDQGVAWGEYMLHMAKVQKLMIDSFSVQVRSGDVTKDMKVLAEKLGGQGSAEND